MQSATPGRAQSHALTGDWATPGLGAVVRFEPCMDDAAAVCGRLIWAWDEARLPHMRIGELMVRDLVWRDGAWRDGRLLNPEDGRTYSGAITPDGDVLRLRGCAGILSGSNLAAPEFNSAALARKFASKQRGLRIS
jgi:uncharacterized protein (DUF2147 family)